MAADPRYDILFEPVQIGPVVAKNRFYQVPHCNGLGYRDPSAVARLREVRAEGGWAVVNTEQAEIHPTSDMAPLVEMRFWDDRDLVHATVVADKIHAHGALAGVELGHNGLSVANLYTRKTPMGPADLPVVPVNTFMVVPLQARRMDKDDIRNMRKWHRDAALRGRKAGFDLVYVYGGHSQCITDHFLSRRYNDRSDEYGGKLENRVRLLREILSDVKDAVGDKCAVPVRLSMAEIGVHLGFDRAEMEDVLGLISDIPDLFDVHLAGWEHDSVTSRFGPEGHEEEFFRNVRSIVGKPVVAVGRYTSPDRMVSLVRSGVLDLIGAARPSIADPFLPNKVKEGRYDEIRECIGCNVCVTGDLSSTPARCTQNPTMGEEWRRGWHPEYIRPKARDAEILIVGAGPTGLEAARALGQRGYQVKLAEAGVELGGRVARECRLPGLSAWGRVRDYRKTQIDRMANVEVFFDSRLAAADVLDFGIANVLVATGATWRADGVGRHHTVPIAVSGDVLTPDDLMAGRRPANKDVLLYDDDHYYIGGVLAELLVKEGFSVTLMTPAAEVSIYTHFTMEQRAIQSRLIDLGVRIVPHKAVAMVTAQEVVCDCIFTGRSETLAFGSVVMVTARLPEDGLWTDLHARQAEWGAAGIEAVKLAGDAFAPATIAHAVSAGRQYAEEFDVPPEALDVPFPREFPGISSSAFEPVRAAAANHS